MQLYRKLETVHRRLQPRPKTGNPRLLDWWPADSPYEVMVGAILTQNTNWKNVERAIANLKKAGVMDPGRVLDTENGKLETLIRPSGYYRQKAERLRLASRKWIEIHAKLKTVNSKQGTGNWKPTDPELRNEWLSVKGIGPETADSICLYAFNRPVFVIDAYTRRFCEHYKLFSGKKYEEYQEFFESNLPKDVGLYKEFHALIVEWAKRVSGSRPRVLKSKTGNRKRETQL